jgi:hypothetical protein
MKKTLRLFTFLAVLVLSISSCRKEQVPIQIMLTDNPADYDSVNVHIQSIRIKMNSDDGGWTTLHSKDTTVNLLDLQNGTTMLIADGTVPDGTLKEVRFILGDGNYIVVNGIRYELATPSAEESGLKIKIDKHLSETLNTFTLDFDADLSIKEENGGYKLMPVIKLK